MKIDSEVWLRRKSAAAESQLGNSTLSSEIDVAERVMTSIAQLAHPVIVSDNMPWIAGGLVSLATACSVLIFLPSSFSLADPWMSFWLF